MFNFKKSLTFLSHLLQVTYQICRVIVLHNSATA